MLGAVAAIGYDILEAVAIKCTINRTAKTARQLLCQLVLPVMLLAKLGQGRGGNDSPGSGVGGGRRC